MEGNYHPASARLAAAACACGAVLSLVEGILRAETFAPDGGFAGLAFAYTEEDLAAKLDG